MIPGIASSARVAFPKFLDASTATAAASTSVSVTPPSGSTNDFLIAIVFSDTEGTSCVTPSGWTLYSSEVATFYKNSLHIFTKIATASESSVLFSLGKSSGVRALVVRYQDTKGIVAKNSYASGSAAGAAGGISVGTLQAVNFGLMLSLMFWETSTSLSSPADGGFYTVQSSDSATFPKYYFSDAPVNNAQTVAQSYLSSSGAIEFGSLLLNIY